MRKKGQISFEYLILMGFVTLILAAVLGIALFYSSSVEDQVKISQINKFSSKIISTSEYVFSSGFPSKSTIKVYLPQDVLNVTFDENILLISFRTSSGLNKIGFPSPVNITGTISESQGIKKIEIVAEANRVAINQV